MAKKLQLASETDGSQLPKGTSQNAVLVVANAPGIRRDKNHRLGEHTWRTNDAKSLAISFTA